MRPFNKKRLSAKFDMNKGAVFHGTQGPLPSRPIVAGVISRQAEADRLKSSYSMFHGSKVVFHNRRTQVVPKPSSKRLFVGTNECAEELTGQRMPLNAFAWKSETRSNFDGKVARPSSAPTLRRIISSMDNQEPIFGKIRGDSSLQTLEDLRLCDINPHQSLAPSQFRGNDMYQTTYSFTHRPFGRDERMDSQFWLHERQSRPWLQEPVTKFELPVRHPSAPADNLIYPNDAQLATLPHYLDPHVKMGKSEVQEEFKDPFRSEKFYFEEPNKIGKPVSMHLQKTFIS